MLSLRTIDVPRALALPYIGLAAWLGLGFLLGSDRRTATPSMEAPKTLATTLLPGLAHPMDFWGLIFLLGAALLTCAALLPERLHRRVILIVLLFVGGVMYAFWGAVFQWGALSDPRASVNAPGLYWFVSAMHFIGVWFANTLRVATAARTRATDTLHTAHTNRAGGS